MPLGQNMAAIQGSTGHASVTKSVQQVYERAMSAPSIETSFRREDAQIQAFCE
jgi:hypothetical protein